MTQTTGTTTNRQCANCPTPYWMMWRRHIKKGEQMTTDKEMFEYLEAEDRHVDSLAVEFENAMKRDGWTPVYKKSKVWELTYLAEWEHKKSGIVETNAAAQAHYLETGSTPPPLGGETEPEGDYEL